MADLPTDAPGDAHASSAPPLGTAMATNAAATPAARRPVPNAVWWALWLLSLALVAAGSFAARRRIVEQLSTAQAQSNWEAWRAHETDNQQNQTTPIRRKIPKSDQPPALVLLRDHFAVVLTGALVIAGFFFGFLLLMLRGVLGGSPPDGRARSVAPTS